jgi:hypothetical protein
MERIKQVALLCCSVGVIIGSQSFQDYWKTAIAPHLPEIPIKVMGTTEQASNAAAGDFDKAYQIIRKVEGGYSKHPDDTGGETYKGITIAVAKKWGYDRPQDLSDTKIKQIYLKDYWEKSGANNHPWPLNLAIFNSYVNSGRKWKIPATGTPQEKALAYLQQQTDFYDRIITNDPSQRVFSRGWKNRSKIIKEAIRGTKTQRYL